MQKQKWAWFVGYVALYVEKYNFSFSYMVRFREGAFKNCLTNMINRFDNMIIKCSYWVSTIFYKIIAE